MFRSPKLKDLEDGLVTAVDTNRAICSVQTVGGRVYSGVRWITPIGSDDVSPAIGDSVLITSTLGYPLILGKKPVITTSEVPPANPGTTGTALPVFSNPAFFGVSANPHQTSGTLQKDKFWRTGTSLFGLLRTGTIVLKTHALAQIILSKVDLSLRIVARSFERFSDWGDEVVANYYGRLYRYIGFNTNFSLSKSSSYLFDQIEGDVAAGEYATTNPFGTPSPAPATTTEIRKKRLRDTSGNFIMVETLATDGSLTVSVTQSAATQNSVISQTNSEITNKVQTTATSGESVVTQQNGQWEVYMQGVTLTLTPTSLVGVVGNSQLNLTTSQAVLSSNGHAVTVTSSGVALS